MTYNQLVTLIETQFAQPHFQINKFEEGFVDDLDQFLTKNEFWPAMYMQPIFVRELVTDDSVSAVAEYEFRFFFIDLIKNDDNNLREVISDRLSVARDFVNWVRQAPNDINLLENPTIEPIRNIDLDYCAGWVCTVLLEVNVERSDCTIPSCPVELPPPTQPTSYTILDDYIQTSCGISVSIIGYAPVGTPLSQNWNISLIYVDIDGTTTTDTYVVPWDDRLTVYNDPC